MSPAVEAAIIAGSVGVLTLIGTLATQYYGIRRTSKDTLNARFATAADKLGSEAPAVRLAGVYAMAGLADDWPENRQTCVDVLCGYLRMPYEPEPGEEALVPERLAFHANREVRHTVIRVITAHLRDKAAVSWQGLNFDFTGVVFDGGDFSGARFSRGKADFTGAEFSGGTVDFTGAKFSGGEVDFVGAKFSGSKVHFGVAKASGLTIAFNSAEFSGSTVDFNFAEFSGGTVAFVGVGFSGGEVAFNSAEFSGGMVDFGRAEFSGGTVAFVDAKFSRGEVDFGGAEFSGSQVDFTRAEFPGGTVFSNPGVAFKSAKFSRGEVDFNFAEFSGGTVDFSYTRDWSVPPAFDWPADSPPQGVRLPRERDQPQEKA